MYNFQRQQLVPLLCDTLPYGQIGVQQLHDNHHLYYSFTPGPGIKFIALDCYEISVLGYEIGGRQENCIEAAGILLEKHGKIDYELWDTSGRLEGLEQRFQMQNGAISSKQLKWLEAELADSDTRRQKVVVFGHVGLLPASCDPTCLLWNYAEVIECFARHPSVVAYLAGHAHAAGHGCNENGVHYLVFNGVIETTPESDCYSTLTLTNDKLEVRGYGSEKSMSLKLANRYQHEANGCHVEKNWSKIISVSESI